MCSSGRKLEDCEAAEQYCAEIGRPDAYMQLVQYSLICFFSYWFKRCSLSFSPSWSLLRLLEMYLEPINGKEPMFKAAVRLLHNHGEMLDPLQVLEVPKLILLPIYYLYNGQ